MRGSAVLIGNSTDISVFGANRRSAFDPLTSFAHTQVRVTQFPRWY